MQGQRVEGVLYGNQCERTGLHQSAAGRHDHGNARLSGQTQSRAHGSFRPPSSAILRSRLEGGRIVGWGGWSFYVGAGPWTTHIERCCLPMSLHDSPILVTVSLRQWRSRFLGLTVDLRWWETV